VSGQTRSSPESCLIEGHSLREDKHDEMKFSAFVMVFELLADLFLLLYNVDSQ
jgi:hypothetical protein